MFSSITRFSMIRFKMRSEAGSPAMSARKFSMPREK